jgi:hypothetical protein
LLVSKEILVLVVFLFFFCLLKTSTKKIVCSKAEVGDGYESKPFSDLDV